MQTATCSYSALFGATPVATVPNGVRIFPNGVRIFPNGVRIFPNGVRIFSNGVRIFPNGVRIFPNGVRIFQNGVRIFSSSLLSACSYQSSAKKMVVATDNCLSFSPFSDIVARVARFSHAHYTRARHYGGNKTADATKREGRAAMRPRGRSRVLPLSRLWWLSG